jgi:hypothetical protein
MEFEHLDACLGLASGAAYWLSLTRDETDSFAVKLVVRKKSILMPSRWLRISTRRQRTHLRQ